MDYLLLSLLLVIVLLQIILNFQKNDFEERFSAILGWLAACLSLISYMIAKSL